MKRKLLLASLVFSSLTAMKPPLQKERAQIFYPEACIIASKQQQAVFEAAKEIKCPITVALNRKRVGLLVRAQNVAALLTTLRKHNIPFEEISKQTTR